MKVLRGDLEITKNTIEELTKVYSKKFELEVRSAMYAYDTDCPSHDKIQALIDTLVVVDEYKTQQGLDNR